MQINAWFRDNPDIVIERILQSESMVTKESQVERNMSISVFYRQPG